MTLLDDGLALSFAPANSEPWAIRMLGQLSLHEGRRPADRRQLYTAHRGPGVAPLVYANAFSSVFVAEGCDGAEAHAQRFERGKVVGPIETRRPWGPRGTRFTFTPDLNILDHPIATESVTSEARRLAMLAPGLVISVNGERFCFDSLRAASEFTMGPKVPWAGLVADRSVRTERFVLRYSLGLAEHGDGHVKTYVNLAEVGGSHRAGLLAALADAVKLPSPLQRARCADLLGVLSLEIADPHYSNEPDENFETPWRLQMPEVEAAVRAAMLEPFSVLLDSIPGSREALVKRWAEAARREGKGGPSP